jgi:hypothetical protein
MRPGFNPKLHLLHLEIPSLREIALNRGGLRLHSPVIRALGLRLKGVEILFSVLAYELFFEGRILGNFDKVIFGKIGVAPG